MHVHGYGDRTDASGVLVNLFDMSNDRSGWSIGGGLSILYDL
jgi:hypothetical protein